MHRIQKKIFEQSSIANCCRLEALDIGMETSNKLMAYSFCTAKQLDTISAVESGRDRTVF
jgi:hypothetical protein